MADAVLDASAIIAILLDEYGSDAALAFSDRAAISTVTACEVASALLDKGAPLEIAAELYEALGLTIEAFTASDADTAAELRPQTRSQGLSLGDRACLALAIRLGVPAITADHAWNRLTPGIADIRLIR